MVRLQCLGAVKDVAFSVCVAVHGVWRRQGRVGGVWVCGMYVCVGGCGTRRVVVWVGFVGVWRIGPGEGYKTEGGSVGSRVLGMGCVL